MRDFEPSNDFVARVMKEVRLYEDSRSLGFSLGEALLASRLFRYAMSGGGIFAGIFLSPVVCI
jgi:hypothetical protein